MSKASKIIREIQARRKAARIKQMEPETFADPDDPMKFFTVQADGLWWMLANRMIQRHEYYAARQLQGVYLSAQIQPPRCLLGAGFKLQGQRAARTDRLYPDDFAFNCLRQLAQVRRRMSERGYQILDVMFCRYWHDDKALSQSYRSTIRQGLPQIQLALAELAYATGYTTEKAHGWYGQHARYERPGRMVLARGNPTPHDGNDAPDVQETRDDEHDHRPELVGAVFERGRVEGARVSL